ncbi:MAG: hypothetical protein QM774_13225 [Gordonia sp. (in: high G+C Gram-positive bacteria)]
MEKKACVCGHARDAHEHHRRGTDCALCDCEHYRSATGARALLSRFTRR